jgi:hypothetical protein
MENNIVHSARVQKEECSTRERDEISESYLNLSLKRLHIIDDLVEHHGLSCDLKHQEKQSYGVIECSRWADL